MPKLTYNCPLCGKQLKLKSETLLGAEKLFEYTCGHVFSKDITQVSKQDLDFTSASGEKHARHYQEDGIKFIIESDFNCIIGDQMRLGKTPQALLALKNRLTERSPCLILVRSANLWQWIREFKTWTTELPNGIFPILGSKAWVPPGFSAYIISMDTFSRPAVRESLKKIPFKLIIADEAHSFKNTDSNRSQALVDFVAFLNTGEASLDLKFACSRCDKEWIEKATRKFDKRIGHKVISQSSKCPTCHQYCYVRQEHSELDPSYKKPSKENEKVTKLLALSNDSSTTEHERALALSKATEINNGPIEQEKEDNKPCGLVLLTGTPILNRAEEYFVPLNLINPERFSSLERFRQQWLEQDSKGKWNRVKPYYLESFKEAIKPIMLRREKEDVYKELPKLNKIYTLIEPDKSSFTKAYNQILDKMEATLALKANPTYWDLADNLMELRRICGMMKISWTTDYLEACALESSTKYALGIHHESVRDVLYLSLGSEKNCYKLSGQDNAERKDWLMRNWETSDKQFLIINMIAGGVGMDFHYCDNALILERGWNSEVESQFEFRFYNPDMSIKKNPTNIEYIVAKGTIDEWFYDMIESKRKVVGETVYTNFNLEQEPMSFKSLIEQTVGNRL